MDTRISVNAAMADIDRWVCRLTRETIADYAELFQLREYIIFSFCTADAAPVIGSIYRRVAILRQSNTSRERVTCSLSLSSLLI